MPHASPEIQAVAPVEPGAAHRSSRRTRVLVLIKCLGHGGAERLLVDMVRHRDRVAFDYEVAVVLANEVALVPEVRAAGVPVHELGATGNRDLSWTVRLRHLLQGGAYDVVHTHLPYAATLGRLVVATLPAGRRPAVVYTEHSMWDRMAIALRVANRLTVGLDRRLLVVSESARRSLPRALRPRATVVIHGIDLAAAAAARDGAAALRRSVRHELGAADGELLAVTVANLRPEKGHEVLLRAARRLVDEDVPVRLAVAGRGPMDGHLRELHAELGLGDRLQLLGHRDDVLRLLAGADCFVLPSLQEGLPVALMEASAMGVPMVVTAVGELPELLTDGEDALVVPPGDATALARAVAQVVADAELRHRLAEGAAARRSAFDVAAAVQAVEDCYQSVARR